MQQQSANTSAHAIVSRSRSWHAYRVTWLADHGRRSSKVSCPVWQRRGFERAQCTCVRACMCDARAVVSRTAAGRRRETKRREAWERNSQREHKAANAPFPAASRRLPTLAYTCHVTWPTREIRPTTRCDASRRAMRESWENSKTPPDRVQLGAYLWIGFEGGF